MKYQAKQLQSGKWAVFTGKKYFTNTVTDSKQKAKESALILSAQYYRGQADKALQELENLVIKNDPSNESYGKLRLEDETDWTDPSDLLC